jgi:ABC-type amino acid transport substrate-binding protein
MRKFTACGYAVAAAMAATMATVPSLAQKVLTGQAAFTDYTKEQPGVRRLLTVADLPAPYATRAWTTARRWWSGQAMRGRRRRRDSR